MAILLSTKNPVAVERAADEITYEVGAVLPGLQRKYQPRSNKLMPLRMLAGFLAMLLLFSGCESLTEEELNPAEVNTNSRTTSTMQTVISMNGAIAEVACTQEVLPSGEIVQLCMPAHWNGELILYAHGYVPDFAPLSLPDEAAIYGPLFTSFGYAFATTSYHENGIAVQSGIGDMISLRNRFIQQYQEPKHIYLTGGSQGGLITTLALERYPDLFSGGLSLCGPCGYFQGQINYYANFRVLFDYFFPGVLPGDAVHIPDVLRLNWESQYVPAVLQAIQQNPAATEKLIRTSLAPVEANDPNTVAATVIGVLTYDVLYTQNAQRVLGGQPFDNRKQVYFGTGSFREDLKLNLHVQRFSADRAATREIKEHYETSGDVERPLIGAHTTKDPIVLYWNLPLYNAKTYLKGKNANFVPISVQRYGHCTFTEGEIVTSFALLAQKVLGQEQPLLAQAGDAQGKVIRSVRIEKR